MDKVIETLYSIEERAQRILETTNNEKNSLREEYDSLKADYEANVNLATKQQLTELELKLKSHFDNEHNEIKKQTQAQIENLNHNFTANHTKVATEIFNQIIGA